MGFFQKMMKILLRSSADTRSVDSTHGEFRKFYHSECNRDFYKLVCAIDHYNLRILYKNHIGG